jgi:hypothetical protein
VRTAFLKTDAEHLGSGVCHDIQAIPVVRINEDKSSARHDIDQPPKAKLDFFKIGKDVSVVELNVIDNHCFREVMEKLRAFIEERGVVFITFNHEILGICERCPLSKVIRYTADQKTRVKARLAKEPGD